jgi:hypothetical protein
MHSGEEGVPPSRATLLGIVMREDRAFIADAVDVGRLADHQSAMVDARLVQADVVAHDKEDVGLLRRLLGGRRCADQPRRRYHHCRAEQRCTGPLEAALFFARRCDRKLVIEYAIQHGVTLPL